MSGELSKADLLADLESRQDEVLRLLAELEERTLIRAQATRRGANSVTNACQFRFSGTACRRNSGRSRSSADLAFAA
ncbi:MAG: hypothetical protein QM775_05180 [Pirellulales bacterium]